MVRSMRLVPGVWGRFTTARCRVHVVVWVILGMCSVGSVRERGAEGESRENRGDNHRSGASRFARKRVFRSSISRSCSPSVESSVIEPTGRVRFPLTKLQGPKSQTRYRGCISGIGPSSLGSRFIQASSSRFGNSLHSISRAPPAPTINDLSPRSAKGVNHSTTNLLPESPP